MSQVSHNPSPSDHERSKRSRVGSQSVAFVDSISGSENPSLPSSLGGPLSPSPPASEEERIKMIIETKEKEVKEKQTEIKEYESKLDVIRSKLENPDANVTEIQKAELREEKIFRQTRLMQMGGEILAMRQELRALRGHTTIKTQRGRIQTGEAHLTDLTSQLKSPPAGVRIR